MCQVQSFDDVSTAAVVCGFFYSSSCQHHVTRPSYYNEMKWTMNRIDANWRIFIAILAGHLILVILPWPRDYSDDHT